MNTHELADELAAWSAASADGLWRRFMPTYSLPEFQFGARTFAGTRSSLLECLTAMHRAGISAIAEQPLVKVVVDELRRIDPRQCKTWWSLAVSDCLCAFGDRFLGHPLLADLSEGQRRAVAQACDTTHVVDRSTGKLIGHPVNYWIVVLRCEHNRLRLGLTDDLAIFEYARAGCREALGQGNSFMDDSEEGRGRYDTYAGHGVAATLELPDQLGEFAPRFVTAWEGLLRACSREDGGSIAWGRSGGHCSMQDLLSRGSAILAAEMSQEPDVLAGLCLAAARALMRDWWRDDALSLHRGRHPHWYFGTGRVLERSVHIISSLCQAAVALRRAPAIEICEDPAVLYPQQSRFIAFDERGPGVWCVRKGDLRFQVPLTDGFTSDYVAAPVWPGCFEQVSDRGHPCGVPVVEAGGKRWLPLRRPEAVSHCQDGLRWTTPCWSHLVDWDWWKGGEDRPGSRQVHLAVDGDTIVGQEVWTFAEVPEAVGFWFAESLTPISIEWTCPHAHLATTVVTDGMADWQSHYHPIRRLHQIEIEPALEMRLQYRLRLA